MKIEISVIMSVYNDECYIMNSVQSVLNQTFKNFEFIIIDDASTDGTFEILKKLNDDRIKLYRNKENQGLTKNLNFAIKKSVGKYIVRIDSDDICCVDRLEKQYNFILNKKDIDIIGSNAYLIDEKNHLKGITNEVNDNAIIKEKLNFMNALLHPSVLMKANMIKKFLYNENYRSCQDFELWNRIKDECNFYNLKEPLIFYRLNTKGITRMEIKNKNKRLEILNGILSNNSNLMKNEIDLINRLMLNLIPKNMEKDVLLVYRKIKNKALNKIFSPIFLRYFKLRLLKYKCYELFILGLKYYFLYFFRIFFCKLNSQKINKKLNKAIENKENFSYEN